MFAERPPTTGASLAHGGPYTLRKLASSADADPDALNVTLYRRSDGAACGWYIGPLATVEGRASLPYLPQSRATRADVAVVRAVEAGRSAGCAVCVIDPDDLWDKVWRG